MGVLNRVVSGIFDESSYTTDERPAFVDHVLSDLLVHRVYDPEDNLYHNDGSVGFLLETPPIIGTDVFATLETAIKSYCPTAGSLQFISWSSPNLMPALTSWSSARRVNLPLLNKMVERRIGFFNDIRFGTDDVVKTVPHRRRVLIAGWIEGDPEPPELKRLIEFRRNLVLAFGGDTHCLNVQPASFLEFMTEVLHSRGDRAGETSYYDPDESLNYQVPGAGLSVANEGLSFMNAPELAVSSATVRMVPSQWSAALGALYNGSPDKPSDNPHGPVLMSLVARSLPNQKALGQIVTRRASLEHSKSTKFGKFMPDLGERDQELSSLQNEIEKGERLFETLTTVSAYARGDIDESRAALSEMAKIMAFCGIALERDAYLQLPVFLAGLPFQVTGPILQDMRRAGRVKKRKGAAVTALAPLHGEWTGMQSFKGPILVGRQGGLFDWDPYVSSGNYNVSVVGKSGAGKSVFMQELVGSIYATGGRVLVIDDGHSFKTTCELFEGEWVGIDASGNSLKLNPFSMLEAGAMENQEYRADALGLISRVVSTMANLGEQREGRVAGIEEEHIENACAEVWEEHGTAGSVTEVVEKLVEAAKSDERLNDVVTKLKRYARTGIYGKMFDGPSNVSINSGFTVFELSDLKAKKDLEAVVLQIIMFLGTELMFKTSRDTRVAILIDEAWDMLGGAGTANFLEGVVRRARKHSGSLITGTQSMNDYYNNKAALVCLENSDWNVWLSQKPEVIDNLVANGRLQGGDGIAHSLKTLTSVPGQFSELGIRGPDGWVFGRLMLDPYSLAVFSTKGSTFQQLKDLVDHRGLNIGEALEVLVENGAV